ncbi:DNA cytosine methyltransferase [Actinosynnema sp. NPDC023658]|uniref:DNA cytosine methyltransferase n=1 Tax=Actinosynnema sp. NPDC023658 TaxID=3155465 RepID=UPI0033D36537
MERQDISAAGKRAGIEKGGRSGLWTDIVAGLRLLRPALVVVENVAALRRRGEDSTAYSETWPKRGMGVASAPPMSEPLTAGERVFLVAWLRVPRPDRAGVDAADRVRRLVQRCRSREHPGRPVWSRQLALLALAMWPGSVKAR